MNPCIYVMQKSKNFTWRNKTSFNRVLSGSSKLCFMLSTKQVCKVAYDFESKSNITLWPNWITNGIACAKQFSKTTPYTLSIRMFQALSFSRATKQKKCSAKFPNHFKSFSLPVPSGTTWHQQFFLQFLYPSLL